jgi:Flp pilus assembly protein TadD
MDVSEDRIDDSFAETIDRAQEKLRLDPEDAWALQQIGYYQYLAEDTERCLATYQKFVDLYPDEPAGYNNLALVYKRKGEFETEETLYLRALALKSNDTHAINNRAVNLAHQERFDEALELMAQLEALTPIDPYANLHRAKIYAAMGNDDEALAYLKSALQGMNRLDTLHHIEFRQDIRLDPAFDSLRSGKRFARLLMRYYGADALSLVRRSNSD